MFLIKPSVTIIRKQARGLRLSSCSRSLVPSKSYEVEVRKGTIRHDALQFEVAKKLDALFHAVSLNEMRTPSRFDIFSLDDIDFPRITEKLKGWTRPLRLRQFPKGLYLYGGVGIGKTFLMDIFYQCCLNNETLKTSGVQRIHFHEFMLNVHQRMHGLKMLPIEDLSTKPLQAVAKQIANEAKILCFDEFQVTDIGDAVILKGLFSSLFDHGVIVVATSNRAPHELYEGGLNRTLFIPFIEFIQERCEVLHLSSQKDYRAETVILDQDQTFFTPLGKETTQRLWGIFRNLTDEKPKRMALDVGFGRQCQIERACRPTVAFFEFRELCSSPLSSVDYLSIAQVFDTIIIDNIPVLDQNLHNEARRFITLVDALYESNTAVFFGSQVPLDDLFFFQEGKTSNDDFPAVETWLSAFGGSSGRSTTMIEEMEWSATGRAGASLAEYSASRDVAFAFDRAKSRLKEMQGLKYRLQRTAEMG